MVFQKKKNTNSFTFMEKLTAFILRIRYLTIVIVLLLTVLFGYKIKDLKVNADVLGYLPDDDAAAMLFSRIGEDYGGNELIIIGIEGESVFSYEMLEIVRKVSDSVRTVSGIGYVTSLTNVIDIRGDDGFIEIGRLIDEYDIPQDENQLAELKKYALSKAMYRGNLVSADGTATLVVAKVLGDANRTDVVEQIQEKLKDLDFDGRIYYGGMPVTLLELSRTILHDVKFIAPIAFILISLMLALGFRSRRGVFLPMLTVVIAIVWTMGLISMLGYALTLLTNVIPVILMAVGSAYAIHVVNRVNEKIQEYKKEALKEAIMAVMIPVLLASVTTIIGFLSFIAGSYLTMIREFGIFTAIGIAFSLVLTLVFLPALISIFDRFKTKAVNETDSSFIRNISHFFSRIALGNQPILLATWMLIIVVSIWGITRIERRVDLVDYFKKDNQVQLSEHLLRTKFNGSMPLYIKIKGDMQSPEVLHAMKKAQTFMAQYEYIPYSQSVADLIEEMNSAIGEGMFVPDDKTKIVQLWMMLEGQEIMDQLVNYTLDEGIIQANISTTDLEVLREIEENFEAYIKENSNEIVQMEVTGIPIMFKRLDDSIIKSQIYSLIIAILLVVVFVSLLQTSLLNGLLTIIPVGATLIVLFGTMGIAGIPLDIATVLTGSVTIGIGIDYAIHFMTQFGNLYQKNFNTRESIAGAINSSGRAIIINVFSVTVGFAVLLFSNLVPLQRFGFLIAVTMIVSGLAALTLLPAALLLTSGKLEKSFRKKLKV
jgi:uncharacterized protein